MKQIKIVKPLASKNGAYECQANYSTVCKNIVPQLNFSKHVNSFASINSSPEKQNISGRINYPEQSQTPGKLPSLYKYTVKKQATKPVGEDFYVADSKLPLISCM